MLATNPPHFRCFGGLYDTRGLEEGREGGDGGGLLARFFFLAIVFTKVCSLGLQAGNRVGVSVGSSSGTVVLVTKSTLIPVNLHQETVAGVSVRC